MAEFNNDQRPVFIAEDSERAVASFCRMNEITLDPERIHGVRMGLDGLNPELQVLTEHPNKIKKLPNTFTFALINEPCEIPVRVIEQKLPVACTVMAGESAGWVGHTTDGTAGWNVFLDNDLMCLSARHAVCDFNKNDCIGDDVWLDGVKRGTVFCHQPLNYLDPTVPHVWDLAAVKYTDRMHADALMRPCQAGHNPAVHPYPAVMTPSSLVGPGPATFHVVGNFAPVCEKGKLLATGATQLVLLPGGMVLFVDQLIFEDMAQKGDSGAVVVRSSGNSVTGLVIGRNLPTAVKPGETICNPIYRFGWIWIGDNRAPNNSGRLPVFTRVPPPAGSKRCFG